MVVVIQACFFTKAKAITEEIRIEAYGKAEDLLNMEKEKTNLRT